MSATVAAAAAAASIASSTTSHSHSHSHSPNHNHNHNLNHPHHHLHHLHHPHHQSLLSTTSSPSPPAPAPSLSRYESQKRRDWNTFGQYLKNHRPPLALSRCSGAHVLEFLRYLDQFGKTKVHADTCPFYGQPNPPAPCPCPLRQAWGSLDALIGRLRAAFEENGGQPETNPFGARAVRLYLREVRDSQAKARGIAYEKKKRKKPPATTSQQYGTSPSPPNPSPSPSTNNNNVNVSPSLSGYDDHDLNYDRNNGGMSSSSSARGSISSMIPLSVFN